MRHGSIETREQRSPSVRATDESAHDAWFAPPAPDRSAWRTDRVPLPIRHYRFLNRRVDLPLHQTWADWLWERALRRGEAAALETYGLDGPAYRCAPNPKHLRADISAAVASGALTVGPLSEAPERALAA